MWGQWDGGHTQQQPHLHSRKPNRHACEMAAGSMVALITLLPPDLQPILTTMKQLILALLATCSLLAATAQAAPDTDSSAEAAAKQITAYLKFADSVEKAMKYSTGVVSLPEANATLRIPAGFKFLNAEQSRFVVHDVWNNPGGSDVLGMIFPANGSPFADSSYAFVITFDAMGYVKDDDAKDIDYAEMLKSGQEEEKTENAERTKAGYEPIHWVGWAQAPYYDANSKVLHWAKELKFGTDKETPNTLNYEIRILGRKGVLSLNAVATMSELPLVKKDIDAVLGMASFEDGYAYKDFDSNTDEIAAYTVGGLVAGKVLAKAGFFALLLKGWKFILIGLVAAWAAIKRFVLRKKEPVEESPATTDTAADTAQPEEGSQTPPVA